MAGRGGGTRVIRASLSFMPDPQPDELPELALDGDGTEDDVKTDSHDAIPAGAGPKSPAAGPGGEWGDAASEGLTVPVKPGMALVGILRAWTRAEGPDMAAVAKVLSGEVAAIDEFLSQDDEAKEFGRTLLSGEIYDFGAATDEGRSIPKRRWLALARTAPEAFVWHVPPPYALPIEDTALSKAFAAELLPWVERADLRVTLNWLGAPGFLDDDDAVDRIADLVRAQAPVVGWGQSVDALEAMVRRGGRWQAARTLERLLRELRPDRAEAQTIQRVARKCMDAQLFARIACEQPWKTDDAMLGDLADRIPTASLARGFEGDEVVRRVHLRGEAAHRVQRIAWRALSERREQEAMHAVSRLVMAETRAGRNDLLCREMLAAMQKLHGAEAVESLTAVFLSGIHRSPAGASIEQFLLAHAEASLTAALGELPDWVPSFDESAMERLAWRAVERLDDAAKERIKDHADLVDGVASQRIRQELEES